MEKGDKGFRNLIVCIGEIAIGALLLINPVGFTSVVFMVLGGLLSIWGAARIVSYFRMTPEEGYRSGALANGLLLLLAGLFCIFRWEWLAVTFPILTTLYGVITLVNGVNKVQWCVDLLRLKRPYWLVSLAGAGLTLAFGLMILLYPFSSTAALWTFIAVTLLVEAIADAATMVFETRRR